MAVVPFVAVELLAACINRRRPVFVAAAVADAHVHTLKSRAQLVSLMHLLLSRPPQSLQVKL